VLRSIRDIDVQNKRVLVRVDFNVDLGADGNVIDDFRIRAVLPTVNYLIENNAKVILMSHLGDPEGIVNSGLRLSPVRAKLAELLSMNVLGSPDCIGSLAEDAVSAMHEGEVLLLENLRFHKEEKENNDEFARRLAVLGDVYVNDAFAVCHRSHASVSAITKFLPAYAGLLLEKEVAILRKAVKNPDHPLVVVMGGAKISTKIKLIKNFLDKADHILLGGALANTVLCAQGLAVGDSVVEEEMVEAVKDFSLTNTKIHLPVDTVVSEDKNGEGEVRIAPVGNTRPHELILDIGPETVELFSKIISSAKMIVWNGPMGLFEIDQFSRGTKEVIQAIAAGNAFSIAGGGETIVYLDKTGLAGKFSHISTGGGAMLDFLAGEKMPGLQALETNNY
jgi:3-phosphoglycerate kinase